MSSLHGSTRRASDVRNGYNEGWRDELYLSRIHCEQWTQGEAVSLPGPYISTLEPEPFPREDKGEWGESDLSVHTHTCKKQF